MSGEDWRAEAREWADAALRTRLWDEETIAIRVLGGHLRRALDEIAEYRARLGLEAPEGWERSDEALWEKLVGPVDADGEPRDGALLVYQGGEWIWWTDVGVQGAGGEAPTVLEAMRAAEEAAGLRERGTE